MIRDQSISHRSHGHKRKQSSRNPANAITKVEETNGKAAENDGKVEP